jgi:sec-independent protein translocase protein TatB
MEILGIGASELVFILIIAIIILGPKDMQKAGRTIGRWLNYFVRSDGWKALQRASQEIKRLPTSLMREANLEMKDIQEIDRDLRRTIDPRPSPRTTPKRTPSPEPTAGMPPSQPPSATPEPPALTSADIETDKEQND